MENDNNQTQENRAFKKEDAYETLGIINTLTEAATVDFCLSWYTLKMQRFTFWKMKPHPERSLI